MDIDDNNSTIINQKSTRNKKVQHSQQVPLFQNYNDHSTRRKDQHGRQADSEKYQPFNGQEQKKEIYCEFEEELWKELEKVEQQEKELKRQKKVWEQECLKLFLGTDEYEQTYVEHAAQHTAVEEMDIGKAFQQQDETMKHIQNSKQYQQHPFEGHRKLMDSFKHFQFSDNDTGYYETNSK
ncbi:unnamed protein product [Rotaria sp. Silwood1]|nr:unnamed protein product [Rotaria sp. Silwood1]CAF1611947.1 unnamed protein product [Rotaria sp. Silwood1]CAF3677479.1 unnamed protein product [Rotaria sp. Silwood1]CAF3704728.1 unnamed protein product [Rotaria sp. Silwood1]CAF3719802.1 unnamed protein product [Rotaria sp. Silwood1]